MAPLQELSLVASLSLPFWELLFIVSPRKKIKISIQNKMLENKEMKNRININIIDINNKIYLLLLLLLLFYNNKQQYLLFILIYMKKFYNQNSYFFIIKIIFCVIFNLIFICILKHLKPIRCLLVKWWRVFCLFLKP